MPYLSHLPWHLLFRMADTYYGSGLDCLESGTKNQKRGRKTEAVIENGLWQHTLYVSATVKQEMRDFTVALFILNLYAESLSFIKNSVVLPWNTIL